jgi:prepilin-type processing-associated H-X9-DG protein
MHEKKIVLTDFFVVISIVAVLLAMIFPTLLVWKERDRQLGCAGNMRQLGIAFQEYCRDNDGQLPLGLLKLSDSPSSGYSGEGWGWQIYPYVQAVETYKCPDDSTDEQLSGGLHLFPVSYFYNENLEEDGFLGRTLKGNAANLNTPAKTVLLGECAGSRAALNSPNEGLSHDPLPETFSPSGCGLRFMDGSDGKGHEASRSTVYATGIPPGLKEVNRYLLAVYSPTGARHDNLSNYLMADGHVALLDISDVGYGAGSMNTTDDAKPYYAPGTHGKLASGKYPIATFSTR